MRCRRARSLLSTYCNGELAGRQQVALREHLAECADCRKEAAVYTSVREAVRELPGRTVSAEFNNRLLNRIAAERFTETRTKAYMPKAAPLVRWWMAAPVMATACLAVVAISLLSRQEQATQFAAASARGGDDSYQTVQPVDNPNLALGLDKDWCLHDQLAQSERVSRIVTSMTSQNGFSGFPTHGSGLSQNVAAGGVYVFPNRLRVQPVIRSYETSGSTTSGEDKKVY